MFLKHLLLRNFRNYSHLQIDFCNGVNYIYGDNAHGKTNLLEAIYFLIIGRSFRSKQLSDVIKHGESFFYLEACFERDGVENILKFSYDAKTRYIVHNETYLRSSADILGLLQGTILVPEDIDIIKGSPSCRRRFLDIHVSQHNKEYLHTLIRYQRALKQRNCLLKGGLRDNIEEWEVELSKAASKIVLERYRALSVLEEEAQCSYSKISLGHDCLELCFRNSFYDKLVEDIDAPALQELYLQKYISQREREYIMGKTLSGPQYDDFRILINGHEAKTFGSEGQQRSSVVSMRMGEWSVLNKEFNYIPIIAIDDFGLGMDSFRKESYRDLEQQGQIFITSTDRPSGFDNFRKDFLGLKVHNGTMEQICKQVKKDERYSI